MKIVGSARARMIAVLSFLDGLHVGFEVRRDFVYLEELTFRLLETSRILSIHVPLLLSEANVYVELP